MGLDGTQKFKFYQALPGHGEGDNKQSLKSELFKTSIEGGEGNIRSPSLSLLVFI